MCFVFYENLEAAEKKDKTKQSVPQYFTTMAEQRTFWQRNRRRAFSQPSYVEYLSVRSLGSWNRFTCTSFTYDFNFLLVKCGLKCGIKCGIAHTW